MSAPASSLELKPTVVILDGDLQTQNRLRRIFAEADYRPLLADDAAFALHLLHNETCDVVLLDLEIPDVDGLAFCRLLRAQPSTSKLPVIGFSKSDLESRKVEAFAAGLDDYITKPSTPGEIVSRVGFHLQAAKRQLALLGSNRELQLLSDLGRGLLRALEPQQLVRRVAGATFETADATLCAAYLKTGDQAPVACVFDREGSAEGLNLLRPEFLQRWLTSPAGLVPLLQTDASRFFLRDEKHAVEYTVPLRFSYRIIGALIVAFDEREDCGVGECRLVDAAAQQTALAAHIACLYQSAHDDTRNLAREVDKRTAEAEAQRRFTEAIIDSLPLSLYAIDRDFRIVAWNRNRELGELGIPRGSVLGRNIFEVLTRQKRGVLEAEFLRVFETGEITRMELETTTPNGDVKHWLINKIPMWIDDSGEVSHVITVGEDITERVEANRAVARAEKLAAVGRLAAGVVHEINNPLATISACAEALESRVAEGAFAACSALDDLREYLGLIRTEAFRCKTITNGLLDFSRARAAQHTPVILGEVFSSAARLLSHQSRGGRIEMRIHAPEDLAAVSGDAGQLQQAIIALATNAFDAMPDGGILKITARNEGRSVLVEVSDTGVGISAENIPKIFEPFFTTKEVGRGTGLGLAVCYGILTEHGGSLDVQSTVGVGTTFTISLPIVDQPEN
ncbi:MAG TPA: ATP-binding protein [Pyrinomonadaceae bacterium]|nr:ATP-binding protein [Pyrinomonadaceae bacterium]